MKGYKRHRFLMILLRGLLGWLFKLIFNAKLERFKSDKPYLIVANHTTDYDPVFLGMAMHGHLYFVASDHILRMGFVSRLLEWAFAPISRTKGATDAYAAMGVIRAIRKGASVGLFAEGNRTFNGVTCPLFPATGKLVRSTGAQLVTYKFTGGYLTYPRWAKSGRRGRLTGQVVGVYSPEQLKDMSGDEINALLARDLHEDAYASQREAPVAYKGRSLAQNIQTAMYVCPCCGRVDTIQSKGDRLWCSCGMQARYDVYGNLNSEQLPYKTIVEWDAFQDTQIPILAGRLAQTPFQDENVVLFHVGDRRKGAMLASGQLSMTDCVLRCGGVSFAIADITNMDIVGPYNIMLTASGEHYQIKPQSACCARKYRALFMELKKTKKEVQK